MKKKQVKANGVLALYPANCVDHDDIALYTPDGKELCRLYTLRQQRVDDSSDHYLAMSDFVAPIESGVKDYVVSLNLIEGDVCSVSWIWIGTIGEEIRGRRR